MKLKLSLIGAALLVTQVFALTPQDVEKQIQNIENLPANQRVEKMNELKAELRNMNEQERHEIIKTLAEKFHIEHAKEESHMRDGKKHQNIRHHDIKHQDMEHQDIEHQDMEHQDIEHQDMEHQDKEHQDKEHQDRDHSDEGDR